jgi:hypothetical protein
MVDTSTIVEGAAEVALSVVVLFFPETAPFLAIAKEAIPAIIAARPYIEEAVAKGESAFAAADKVAGLGDKIRALAGVLPSVEGSPFQHLDLVTIVGAGIAVPGWTLEETQKWLDNAAPHNDPSQENSNVGSG